MTYQCATVSRFSFYYCPFSFCCLIPQRDNFFFWPVNNNNYNDEVKWDYFLIPSFFSPFFFSLPSLSSFTPTLFFVLFCLGVDFLNFLRPIRALRPTFEKLFTGVRRALRRAPSFDRAISMICALSPTFMKSTPGLAWLFLN